jgi:hypothetical protein
VRTCYGESVRCAITLVCATVLVACEEVDDSFDEERVSGTAIGVTGGFVTSHDGVFTAVFPPGALRETFVITVRVADDAPRSLGAAYSVQGMASIDAPIFLEYRYAIPQVDGRDPMRLDIARQSNESWLPLPRVGHNENTQTVSASDATVAWAYALIEDHAASGPEGDETTDTDAPTESGESGETGDAPRRID